MVVENMKTLGIAQHLSYIYIYMYIYIYILLARRFEIGRQRAAQPT